MAFTDEDLKRLKEIVSKTGYERVTFFDFDLKALLARLEAAEIIMETIVKLSGSDNLSAYQAWRKTCGK